MTRTPLEAPDCGVAISLRDLSGWRPEPPMTQERRTPRRLTDPLSVERGWEGPLYNARTLPSLNYGEREVALQ